MGKKKIHAMSPKTDRDWKVTNTADTLIRAEEVKSDKVLYRDAVQVVKERAEAAAKVARAMQGGK